MMNIFPPQFEAGKYKATTKMEGNHNRTLNIHFSLVTGLIGTGQSIFNNCFVVKPSIFSTFDLR